MKNGDENLDARIESTELQRKTGARRSEAMPTKRPAQPIVGLVALCALLLGTVLPCAAGEAGDRLEEMEVRAASLFRVYQADIMAAGAFSNLTEGRQEICVILELASTSDLYPEQLVSLYGQALDLNEDGRYGLEFTEHVMNLVDRAGFDGGR